MSCCVKGSEWYKSPICTLYLGSYLWKTGYTELIIYPWFSTILVWNKRRPLKSQRWPFLAVCLQQGQFSDTHTFQQIYPGMFPVIFTLRFDLQTHDCTLELANHVISPVQIYIYSAYLTIISCCTVLMHVNMAQSHHKDSRRWLWVAWNLLRNALRKSPAPRFCPDWSSAFYYGECLAHEY